MTRQITVGYDGSVPSSEAVLWAAVEASVRGAILRIVSCYEMPLTGEPIGGWTAAEAFAELMDAKRSALAEMKELVAKAHPGLSIVTETSADPATHVLVEPIDSNDLVVVGSSSHRGAAAFWLGSTPRYVVRHSPCPVAVVRAATTGARPDRVVVGIDGSPASDRALQWAGNEAGLHNVSLLIVHGWLYPYVAVESASSEARDLTKVDAACLLESAVEMAREQFAVEITEALVEATPTTALLDTVSDGDILVVGSRGRGALAAGMFGSTVNTVLDRSTVPVVVVRGADESD